MIEFCILAGVAMICAVAAYAFRCRREVALERIESDERRHQCTATREASEKIGVISKHVDDQLAGLRTEVSKIAMQAGLRSRAG